MTAPAIDILEVRPAPRTAAPAIVFRLRICLSGRAQAMALRVQIQFDARRRRYDDAERHRLSELFGGPAEFTRLLRPIVWSHASLVLPSFDHAIDCDLTVPCTYDLEVASAKYLHALRDGDVPLLFLFTGTVFSVRGDGLAVEPVSWDLEVAYRMNAATWRAAMDQFFPGGGWVRLEQQTIDRLQNFRGRVSVVSWDAAIGQLLDRAEGPRS